MKFRLALALTVTGALLTAPFVGQVAASQPCVANQKFNYFDGFDTRDLTTYGAYGYIETLPGALCTGANGTSAAWTMVADNFFNGNGGYAQSGYAATVGHLVGRYFSQWRKDAAHAAVTIWGGNASGTNRYITNYIFSAGLLYMYVNSTLYDTTNFDPTIGSWTSPWDSQYFGETWYPQDDMPGIANNKVTFSTLRYVTSRTSGWVAVPHGTLTITGSSRYQFAGNTSQFDIWTDPLQ